MDKIFEAYETKKVRTIKGDFIDRLHSKYTVTLLFVICILITLRQYDNGAIVCWLPAYFSDDQADYAHQLCWVNSTYYYPTVHDADLFPESLKHTIPYYQFILFILFGQALLFYLPSLIWNNFVSDSAGYIKKVLDQIEKVDLIQKSIAKFNDQLVKPIEKRTLLTKKANNQQDDIENKAHSSSSESTNSSENVNLLYNETNSLLLPNEFTESVRNTFQFVRDHKKAKKDSNFGLKLVAINEENNDDNNPPEQEKEIIKKPLNFNNSNQRQVSISEPFIMPDNHNNKIRFDSSKAKKRITSFMKPIKGVEFLASQYMILKVFNLFNVIVQIVLLHAIFGPKFYKYGYDFIYNLTHGYDPFTLSRQFPLITFCDFYVHQNLRQLYWHSTQCILSINIYIEKFYVIIWFWMILLLLVTFLNILSWSHEIYISDKTIFIKKYLIIKERMLNQDYSQSTKSVVLFEDEELNLFQKKYIGNDGFVMLHMIKAVIGDIIFIELLYELWIDFKKNKNKFD
jgi:hypothetical protein